MHNVDDTYTEMRVAKPFSELIFTDSRSDTDRLMPYGVDATLAKMELRDS